MKDRRCASGWGSGLGDLVREAAHGGLTHEDIDARISEAMRIGFVTLGWCGPGERSEGPRLDVAMVLLGLAARIWLGRSRELPRPTSAIVPSSSAAPAAAPTSATSP